MRALTGVDCDRLPEEQARGITLDLGFAPLDLSDGTRLSVVDVPGHEGLVRTMVAGATGIDLMLLVVAADEGVMPQTREHAAICGLLGIDRGVVALTKCDAAADDVAGLAEEEVRELLAPTGLANAPIVRTSAATGAGIEALRSCLEKVAAETLPRTPRAGPSRLAVDRSFVMKGFGTVVTGTLVGGSLAAGEELEVLPEGRRARLRGLQCHGEALDRMEAGARCALNLQGIEVEQVPRGAVVTRPGAVAVTRRLDARLQWLPEAPALEKPTSVLFLVATSEHAARIAPVGDPIPPGDSGFVRIHLSHDGLPLLPGDRFVVRGFHRTGTGGHTLGGGRVLDAAPPHRRLSDAALRRELQQLYEAGSDGALLARIARSGLAGVGRDRLVRETGLAPDVVDAELAALAARGSAAGTADGTWLGAERLADLSSRARSALAAFHAAEPLRPGMPRAALRGALPANAAASGVELALARLEDAGQVTCEGELVRLREHSAELSPEERALTDALREGIAGAGLQPPGLREWCERLGAPEPRLRNLLAWLERRGELVRAPGDLWFAESAVQDLRERVRAHLEREGRLDTPTYKKLIGTTRKHAVPLMELLDGEKLTIRRGELRVLRAR